MVLMYRFHEVVNWFYQSSVLYCQFAIHKRPIKMRSKLIMTSQRCFDIDILSCCNWWIYERIDG